ncbi:LysM peptidoglycan-binding domain-containing protein [Chengkuizengella axinellae]|uniref:LysM peptidoglycan-binding domain-containing protein n=1 Tax=Chengkuizengella axinellae TaxID=3064388 RepID=A0ABT9IZD2_9BACL|nr:LysM peptidoglycan-binding domain-containing protein [Chengkuizengella sp. 2205SS18-9]MDP5274677.1 LysM peptidoglycan-binding domain-containing protein [Chengkuizengella sp. 2205SS18-9]
MNYVVQPGDTLYAIAAKHGVSVQELIDVNGITDPAFLYVGQRLYIPVGGVADTYIVKSGDTLYGIAAAYNVSVSDIITLNNLTDPNMLYVGQQLKIPVPMEPGLETYVVQPGDTLYKIAQNFGVSVTDLIEANNITDASVLYVGQTLVIPMAPEEPEMGTYVVKAGDTLGAIARRSGISLEDLMAINNISDPNMIYVGQVLLVPVLPEEGLAYHIVKPGENIWQIARMYNVRARDLARLNNITDPRTLYVGQVLLIPEAVAAPEPEPEPEPEEVYYTVQEGDTFTSIAIQYGLTDPDLVELSEYNDMPLNAVLEPGTMLKIPPGLTEKFEM